MLFLDVYQDPQGNIKTQYVPNTPKDIKPLRDCLRLLEIQNPLCMFAYRHENGYYDKLTEDETQRDAWVADTLSAFWKKTEDDPGQPQMNAFSVLARMTDAYLAEHEELLDFREKAQRLSPVKMQTKRSRKRMAPVDRSDILAVDPSFKTDEDENENFEFIDFLSYGVGLQAERYSDFLRKHKNVDNNLNVGNGPYYDMSDFAVVEYATSEEYKQAVNVSFYDTDVLQVYKVTIVVDTIADEEFSDVDEFFAYLSENNKISIPYSNLRHIELKVAPLEGPCQIITGVHLSYEFNTIVPEEGIDEVTMLKIYNITTGIQKHICNCVRETKGK